MRGNSAIIKCLIPSFVTDFVQIIAWINEDGDEFTIGNDFNDGRVWKRTYDPQNLFLLLFFE